MNKEKGRTNKYLKVVSLQYISADSKFYLLYWILMHF